MFKKRLIFMVLVCLSLTILTACSSKSITGDNQHSLVVSIDLLRGENISLQTVSDEITLDKLIVTITKDSTILVKEVPIVNNGGEALFENLASGDWNVDVVARDIDGFDCYAGSTVATVINNLTAVDVELYLLNGDLDLTVIFPVVQGININSGTVRLVNPRTGASHVEKPLQIGTENGMADFGSVQAGTWYMEVDLFDSSGNKIIWGSGIMTVLPSRENNAIIEFTGELEGGDLLIRININLSPADPTGVTANLQNGEVIVSWDANLESNIEGYVVYRANSETGFKKLLTYTMISATTYTDTDITQGETYYYWIQAYNTDGYSSDLSIAASITISSNTLPVINSLPAVIDLNVNASTLITVDAADADGDVLSYSWSATYGTIVNHGDGTATYTAPSTVGTDLVQVLVEDSKGGSVSGDITIYISDNVDLIPTMTSETLPSGIATASTFLDSTWKGYPYKAFDDDSVTYEQSWMSEVGVTTGWLAYEFPNLTKVIGYSISAVNGYPTNPEVGATMAPQDWSFEGWDGTQWIILDQRTGITGWAPGEKREFFFQNDIAYIKYRINITANDGHSKNIGLGEMEMYGN